MLYFIDYCMSYYLTDKGMRPIGAARCGLASLVWPHSYSPVHKC